LHLISKNISGDAERMQEQQEREMQQQDPQKQEQGRQQDKHNTSYPQDSIPIEPPQQQQDSLMDHILMYD
jgi:hypothetical protein